MRIPLLIAACAALSTALPSTLHAEETTGEAVAKSVYERLIEARAEAVVSVKMVLTVTGSVQGSPLEQEQNQTATGVLVHSDGLVMLPSSLFTPNIPRRFRAMVKDLKITPSNMRVIFPGDAKEYPAILGAKDSKLGLAFVRIKDLEDRAVQPADLTNSAEPALGTMLYGVSRLGQDFDYAPMCATVPVIASIEKPRRLWLLQRAGAFVAEPLYTETGAVAGIVINQEGVGEDASTRTCLLPLKIAMATIKRSAKAAEIALEEALEAEAEAAEEAAEAAEEAEDGDGEAGGDDAADGDAGDGDKPDAPAETPEKE